MAKIGLREEDIVEKFITGWGNGGQKVNKTASCVYLKHVPTGLEVKCQAGRSRSANRLVARNELCQRLEDAQETARLQIRDDAEKKRRQSRKRSRVQKQRMVQEKRRRTITKTYRRQVRSSEG